MLSCYVIPLPSFPDRRRFQGHSLLLAYRLLSTRFCRCPLLFTLQIQTFLLPTPMRHSRHRPPGGFLTEVQNLSCCNILCDRIVPPRDISPNPLEACFHHCLLKWGVWKVPTRRRLKLFFSSKNKRVVRSFALSIVSWQFFLFLSAEPFGLPPLTIVEEIILKTYVWCSLSSVSDSYLSSGWLLLIFFTCILAAHFRLSAVIHVLTAMASSVIIFTFP